MSARIKFHKSLLAISVSILGISAFLSLFGEFVDRWNFINVFHLIFFYSFVFLMIILSLISVLINAKTKGIKNYSPLIFSLLSFLFLFNPLRINREYFKSSIFITADYVDELSVVYLTLRDNHEFEIHEIAVPFYEKTYFGKWIMNESNIYLKVSNPDSNFRYTNLLKYKDGIFIDKIDTTMHYFEIKNSEDMSKGLIKISR